MSSGSHLIRTEGDFGYHADANPGWSVSRVRRGEEADYLSVDRVKCQPWGPGATAPGSLVCGGSIARDPRTAADRFDDEHYPAYTMGRAAEMLGATAGFLRSLDEVKLLVPQRSAGGHRRYSRYQLRLAGRVRALVDEGTGGRGVPDRHPGGPARRGSAHQRGAAQAGELRLRPARGGVRQPAVAGRSRPAPGAPRARQTGEIERGGDPRAQNPAHVDLRRQSV